MNFLHSMKIPLILLLLIAVLIAVILTFRAKGDNRLKTADENYRRGESATTLSERKKEFNESLDLYLQLDGEYHPNFGNGKLSYNIGNTYFQLEEYPQALFYYKKASRLMPRSDVIKRNLIQAEQKLGIQTEQHSNVFSSFLLQPWLSLPERLQLFFAAGFIAFSLASAWVWTQQRFIWYAMVISLIPVVFLLFNLASTYYFSPIEAVMMHAAELRRDAGTEYAKVIKEPIRGGVTVEVLGTSPNGEWLKILTPEGNLGYVPSEAAKLL
jgi:tetratricopeptide (TPR) repeat protein